MKRGVWKDDRRDFRPLFYLLVSSVFSLLASTHASEKGRRQVHLLCPATDLGRRYCRPAPVAGDVKTCRNCKR